MCSITLIFNRFIILIVRRPTARTRDDNRLLYNALKQISELSSQVDARVLKGLASVAHLDVWNETNMTGKTTHSAFNH